MSLIPEILRTKSLLHSVLFPGLFDSAQAGPASPSASPAGAQVAPARRPGLRGVIEQLVAGGDDPRLDAQQNAGARSRAMIQAGLEMMNAGAQPGATAVGAVTHGLAAGQQFGAEQREIVYGRTMQERVQNALNDPTLVGKLTPAQRSMLALLPPDQAAKALSELLFKDRPQMVVGEGSGVWDPVQGKVVYSQPSNVKPDALPADMRGAAALLGIDLNHATPAQLAQVNAKWQELKRSGATTVSLQQSEAKGLNAIDIAEYGKMRSQADEAQTSLSLLDAMDQILAQSPDVSGGTAEVTLPLRSLLANAGVVDVDKLTNQQVFDKLSKQVMFSQVRSLGGRILQSEISMMNKTVPNLRNTPEANKIVIEAMRRIEQAKVEKASLADQWLSEHGTIVGFDSYLRGYAQAHPLFEGLFPDKAPF